MCQHHNSSSECGNLVMTNPTAHQVRAYNTSIVPPLGDAAISTGSASRNLLPDKLAIVANTKLGSAVAHDGTVFGAGG